MKTSVAMQEIRKIRDEQSLRRLNTTPEERAKESEQALVWLSKELKKPLKVVESCQA
ncbi:MAG: hypothetical protein LBH74_04375 [Nitrososphaerota archaeon]|jgi:hypothetical protein|nr:hypothetical protein [Nitrososphaerota archaeon]